MDTENMLSELNKFTRREHTADEVYMFDIILCDNDVDRDFEAFSDKSLKKLCELFVGKTGIFDHNPKGSNQTARIFHTELVTDENRTTKLNTPYTALKACGYMVRTDSNSDLIKEIDAGIKKEVSISCSAGSKTCSICGADLKKSHCSHVKGRTYGGKLCYSVINDISDAYEWSFVAVPAQVNAGITKKFSEFERNQAVSHQENQIADEVTKGLKEDIVKFMFLKSGADYSVISDAVSKMSMEELLSLRKELGATVSKTIPKKPQLIPEKQVQELSDYRI